VPANVRCGRLHTEDSRDAGERSARARAAFHRRIAHLSTRSAP
jgi:hypothetical protein